MYARIVFYITIAYFDKADDNLHKHQDIGKRTNLQHVLVAIGKKCYLYTHGVKASTRNWIMRAAHYEPTLHSLRKVQSWTHKKVDESLLCSRGATTYNYLLSSRSTNELLCNARRLWELLKCTLWVYKCCCSLHRSILDEMWDPIILYSTSQVQPWGILM